MTIDLDQLTGGVDRASPTPMAVRGRVQEPPLDAGDGLTVELVGYGAAWPAEVAGGHWMSRMGGLPRGGEQCLVVFDNHGDAWVSVWDGPDAAPADRAESMAFFLGG